MGEQVEPCLRKEVCQPRRVDEAEWRCDGCGAEIWFMRAVEPYERPPGAAEDSRRLAEAMKDLDPDAPMYPPDFSDMAGHPRPGAGVPDIDDPQVRIAEELLDDPPVGMAELRMEVEGAAVVPETALDVIAQEIVDIGRTHGWDNFGKMVEQLKKEGGL